MPMDGNDVLLLLSLHMANPGACLHPSPQTLGWGGTSTTFTRGLTFGLTSIRMDTAGGGADDLLGRAALPLKVGHPADHLVILRGRQVICLSLSVCLSVCLCPCLSLHLSVSADECVTPRKTGDTICVSICTSVIRTHARTHDLASFLLSHSLVCCFRAKGCKAPTESTPLSTSGEHDSPTPQTPSHNTLP